MKKFGMLASVVLMFALVAGFAYAADKEEAKAPINDKCPLSGKDVNAAKTVDYKVELCCNNCKGKFEKDPAAYLDKVAAGKPGLCIFSGKEATKTSTITVGLCCDNCKAKFEKEPAKYIGKVAAAKKN